MNSSQKCYFSLGEFLVGIFISAHISTGQLLFAKLKDAEMVLWVLSSRISDKLLVAISSLLYVIRENNATHRVCVRQCGGDGDLADLLGLGECVVPTEISTV